MVERQEQAIPRRELIERSAKNAAVDLTIELTERRRDVCDELDRPPASFDHAECRANNLTSEPRPEGIRISQRGKTHPGGEQGVLYGVRGIGL